MKKNKKSKKKRKINKLKVFTFLVILFLVALSIYRVLNVKITNIIISGNTYYTDQEIIDIAGISDYPKSIDSLTFDIKKRLEDDTYIFSAEVKKNIFLNVVTINVKENYPLFFYSSDNKTVLFNGDKVDEKYNLLTIINKIPDTVYKEFLGNMQKLNSDIRSRMSEIEYKPNEVDDERFLILMNDGNYVYINLKRFQNLNKYVDMVKSFDNKKGILYLDSGEYFDVFDN